MTLMLTWRDRLDVLDTACEVAETLDEADGSPIEGLAAKPAKFYRVIFSDQTESFRRASELKYFDASAK